MRECVFVGECVAMRRNVLQLIWHTRRMLNIIWSLQSSKSAAIGNYTNSLYRQLQVENRTVVRWGGSGRFGKSTRGHSD